FQAGQHSCVIEELGIRIGLLICEDIWEPGPAQALKAQGAQLIAVINGSPYSQGYQQRRESVVRKRVQETGLPVVYVNLLGGQDELVFDGGSFVMDDAGEVVQRCPAFQEDVFVVDVDLRDGRVQPRPGHIEP